MKTIHIIRHAKSSWKEMQLPDHDRPLNKRGFRDAPIMARRFWNRFKHIELWVCSTSVRTKQTCQFFLDHYLNNINSQAPVVSYESSLYHGSVADYFSVIRNIDNGLNSVLFFGHNYTVTDIANMYAIDQIENVPTCGIVSLEFNADKWIDVEAVNGQLVSYMYPKMFT